MEFDRKEFGSRLRRLRKAKKLTAKELGERIGAAESTIICYESGTRTPNVPQVAAIADKLNVSTDFLISEEADELRNLKHLLETNDLNWNGYRLEEQELSQLKDFLEFMIQKKKKEKATE